MTPAGDGADDAGHQRGAGPFYIKIPGVHVAPGFVHH